MSVGLQYGIPLESYVAKFTNLRFEPAGMTDDPDVRIATSVMDYLFRRIALDYLSVDKRAELGIFSAMWNEHCSYKSSKRWLRTLHTTGPQVICGPGENAGVVDLGDNQALVFKMESHNHPSYIEPYQGAATGVGGILRDVFTMGARPIAAMNALSFGEPAHPRTRSLVHAVVAGIGGYGNAFGVPTIGGELRFHAAYNGNCLVNAFAAGLARADAILLSVPPGRTAIRCCARWGTPLPQARRGGSGIFPPRASMVTARAAGWTKAPTSSPRPNAAASASRPSTWPPPGRGARTCPTVRWWSRARPARTGRRGISCARWRGCRPRSIRACRRDRRAEWYRDRWRGRRADVQT